MPSNSSGSGSSRSRGGLAAAAPPTMRPPPTADRRPYAEDASSMVPAGPCHHHHGCPQCHAEAATAARQQQLLNQARKRPLPPRQLQPQLRQTKAAIADSEAAATAGIRRRRAAGPTASRAAGPTASSQQQVQRTYQQQQHLHHAHTGPILRSAPPVMGQQRRPRRRRKVGGAGLLGLLLAWAKRPFVATAAIVTGQRGVLPLDSPFKRGWDVLTVCLSVIFLCIDAVALLRAQGGDHHPATGSSSGNGDGSGGSNGGGGMKGGGNGSPGAGSAAGASGPAAALGAMGLRDLLLLEVLWFAVDMALQFRTEAEVTVVEEDPITGEERERTVLLQEPQAIALHYLQRDFWLDLLFSFPWRGLSALLLLPRRKRPNRFRRLVGGAAKKVGGAFGGAKRAIGDRIPRFMRWGFIKGFVTWTHVLEVKRVDGAKHLVRNRKSYRLLRYLVKGVRSLLSLHVFTFVRRVGNKAAAHWAVGFEEDEDEDEEWESEGDRAAAWEQQHHHDEYHQQQVMMHEQMAPPSFGHAAGDEEGLEEEEEEATAAGSTGSDCEDEVGDGMEEEEQGHQEEEDGPWPASFVPGVVGPRAGVERRTL